MNACLELNLIQSSMNGIQEMYELYRCRAARVLVVGVPVVKLGYAEKNSSTMVSLHRMIVCHSLDDMADQEMEKMRSSRGQYRASQRDFEELMRVIPDPAQEEDGLLAEGMSWWYCCCCTSKVAGDAAMCNC